MLDKWKRNQKLIDFEFIPKHLTDAIVEQYNKPKDAQKQGQLLNYFITNKLKNLMEHIGDFTK